MVDVYARSIQSHKTSMPDTLTRREGVGVARTQIHKLFENPPPSTQPQPFTQPIMINIEMGDSAAPPALTP